MDHIEIETSAEVRAAIFARHGSDLFVFSSYSNPSGGCPLGRGYPEMDTTWGFRGAPCPILRTRTTWERGEADYLRVNEKSRVWLCYPKETPEE